MTRLTARVMETLRGDIARKIKLSNTAVSKIVNVLQKNDMICAVGKRASTNEGGKRAELFSLNRDYRYCMVLMANADWLTCYIYDMCCVLRHTKKCDVYNAAYTDYVDACASLIVETLKEAGIDPSRVLGCCVVAPGIVDSVRGEYVYPIWSPSWGSGLPIIADLKARLPFAMDMQLENNSRIGGYVEGSNCKSDSYVSVISIYDEDEYSGKQGIGGSVVNHHAVRHGAGGYVGEFGHLTVDYGDEETCLCGRKGCLQVMVSAMRLLQNVRERREKYPGSPLWEAEKEGKIRMQQIFDAANAGDPLAMEVMDMAIEYYARAIEHIILTIDPAVIYIGGAYTNAGEYFRKGLNERVRHAGLFGNMNNLEICYSHYDTFEAVHLGAAMYLLDKYLGNEKTFSEIERAL